MISLSRRFLALAAVLLTVIASFSIPVSAYEITEEDVFGNLKYRIVETEDPEYTAVMITGVTFPVKELVIPEKIDNYLVCIIGEAAFKNDTTLESVILPDTMAVIDNEAFYGCTALKTINFDVSQLMRICDKAFYECSSLKSAVLPNSVQYLGDSAFYGCSSIENAAISTNMYSLEIRTFEKCTSLKRITIPDNIRFLSGNVFSKCTSLENIDFKGRPISIGLDCFEGTPWFDDFKGDFLMIDDLLLKCGSMSDTVVIPDSVTELGAKCFSGCEDLVSVTIPDSVTIINSSAFMRCINLKDVRFMGTIEVMGTSIFGNCTSLETIKMPKGLDTLPICCFFQCQSLKNVILPEGYTTIREGAFADCHALETIICPESVNRLDYRAFENCSSLKRIDLPGNVKIDSRAFRNTKDFTIYCHKNSKTANNCNNLNIACHYYEDDNGIIGDVNDDGFAMLDDALAILRHSTEIERLAPSYVQFGDVNDDGSADSSDAIEVMRFSADLPCSENIGKEYFSKL